MTDLYECKERLVPFASSWAVGCPSCGKEFEYSPHENDSGAFELDAAEWPVCEDCGVIFTPETVKVCVIPDGSEAPK